MDMSSPPTLLMGMTNFTFTLCLLINACLHEMLSSVVGLSHFCGGIKLSVYA